MFYSIDSNFDFHVFPSWLSISNNFDGLAIMWRKSLGMKVNVENCSIHYMIIDISIGEWTLGVVNNYMPHDDRSAGMLGDYNRILGELQAYLETMQSSSFICTGDFNSDPNRGRLFLILLMITA